MFVDVVTLSSGAGGMRVRGGYKHQYHDKITYIVQTTLIRPHPRGTKRDLQKRKRRKQVSDTHETDQISGTF